MKIPKFFKKAAAFVVAAASSASVTSARVGIFFIKKASIHNRGGG